MSTTVTYDGATIATVSNETKTLETAGTWLEEDIELTDSSMQVATGTVEQNTAGTTISFSVLAEPLALCLYLPAGKTRSVQGSTYGVMMVAYDGTTCTGWAVHRQSSDTNTGGYAETYTLTYSNGTVTISGRTFRAGTWNLVYAYRS